VSRQRWGWWLVLASLFQACAAAQAPDARVGSKQFTESVLLGEMACGLIEAGGGRAEHRAALGGTRVLWKALLRGEIDVYPEYTGTLAQEILNRPALSSGALRAALLQRGVQMGEPLGFDNTYALGMREAQARRLGITKVSQLAHHTELRFGLTSEFMDRAEGWPVLRARYGLAPALVRGLDHDLAYRGLASGDVDVTDLYATDGEIVQYGLRVLEDDRHVFPDYQAVLLYRVAWAERRPELVRWLSRLGGALDAQRMRSLNSAVKFQGRSESEVSAEFLARSLHVSFKPKSDSRFARIAHHTRDHLKLVSVSLSAAVVFALPLGVLAARYRTLGHVILALVGALQTLPSLALLVFMIPLLGIGAAPAMAALFLYSLLPIVRSTVTGLRSIAPGLLESALALGLSARARLFRIELPLASPAILSGIKTSAVINVGTATLGALIGAGGYGEPILTGIRLDDYGLILSGAVPAALLALVMQGGFDLCERWLVPEGLRAGRA
jgi:osmoprotectant transport system permease protein